MKYFSVMYVPLVTIIFLGSACNAFTVSQLHGKYNEIFSRAHNRNAASHLWASYILNRSSNLTESEIYNLFGGFCPISGSPVYPSSRNLWQGVRVNSSISRDGFTTGNIHVCCWPCVCDLQALVKSDTLTINTNDGTKQFTTLVIGNIWKYHFKNSC